MAHVNLDSIGRPLSRVLSAQERQEHSDFMATLEATLLERRRALRHGWGERALRRIHQAGKLTAWERIDELKDPSSDPLFLGSFVNWGVRFPETRRPATGAGVLTALLQVHGRWVVVVANDNLVASGAWWPQTPEKIQRAQEVALRLRIPIIYLVESSGLFLPRQADTFAGRTGAGAIFRMNAQLAANGVPQIAGVFGPCIAGGGYMPIISDRVIMTENAYMVIAGAALIKGAKSQRLTSLDIGGPEVHVHQSGCADLRVPDDHTCLRVIRDEVDRLPTSAASYYRHGDSFLPPSHSPSELSRLFPSDHRQSYEIREVLARLVDGSLFHEVLADKGQEVITGVARVKGLWVGIIANNQQTSPHPRSGAPSRSGGILYREGVTKLSTFTRHCQEDGLPLFWFQDVAGFDIGAEAESDGLLGYGSSLIYTNSTSTSPVFTILLRRSSGAGYYAQAGQPYRPVLQLATPISRLAVMEGRTLAIATFAGKLDDNFEIATDDPAERAALQARIDEVAQRVEADMDPYRAASRMDIDEIVTLAELRLYLEAFAEMSYQSTGCRRIRNPRIWSLHDLEGLCTGP